MSIDEETGYKPNEAAPTEGRLSRRQLLQSGTAAGLTLVAGCNHGADLPPLQRAYFQVQSSQSGESDIRFAFKYEDTAGNLSQSDIDLENVITTEAPVDAGDTALNWVRPYEASPEEIRRTVAEKTKLLPDSKVKDKQSVVTKLQEIIPDDIQNPLPLTGDATLTGRIRNAVGYDQDRPLTGQRLSLPRIAYSGPTDLQAVLVQTPDGFLYRLPTANLSLSQGGHYELSQSVADGRAQAVSFETPTTTGGRTTFPLGLPYTVTESPVTLVPSFTHRLDRTLPALRGSADRRRVALGAFALEVLENTQLNPNVHPRAEALYNNSGLDDEALDELANLFPAPSSAGGIAAKAGLLTISMYAAALAGGPTGIAIWIGLSWAITLYGAAKNIESLSGALNVAIQGMQAVGEGANADEVFGGGATGDPLPPVDAVESLATLQTDWATASVALASDDDVQRRIQAYHRLLDAQRSGLARITRAVDTDQFYESQTVEKDGETMSLARALKEFLATQQAAIANERALLERFGVHVEATATDVGPSTGAPLERSPTETPTGTETTADNQFVVELNPRATYKRVDPGDQAQVPAPVVLADHGVQPGDDLTLRTSGNYVIGPSDRKRCAVIGVFSRSSEIRERTRRVRVPGAVDAGDDYTTVDTLRGGKPTNIPEDFLVSGSPDDIDTCASRQTTVTVPEGAAYLFLAVEDDRYEDNSGDISVTITVR